jgi:sulfonate transport system permease protein
MPVTEERIFLPSNCAPEFAKVAPSQVRRSKFDFMTDTSLLSRPADATASAAAGGTEPFSRAGQSVVTVVADVARSSKTSGSRARGLTWRSFALPWLLPLGLLLVWQFLSATGIISTAIVPAPSDIWDAARQLAERGELQHDILVSLRRVAIGFSIGALGGLLFGLAVGLFEPLHDLFDRSLQMIRTIPHLALVPLMILWFGIGEEPRLILVAMGSLFPVYINTVGGIRNVDPKLIELGKSYGLGRAELVWSIILPAALQPILVGMRYALGVAWLTLVVGETIASRDGVGYLVQNARELLRIDIIVLAIVLYAIAGWLSDLVTRLIERRLLRWHPNYADRVKA